VIDFTGNSFTKTKFDSKQGLSYRYRAIKKLCEDSDAIGFKMDLPEYQEVKAMRLENIHILFEILIKQFCDNYREHITENL
jgi:hypothetical protein